MLVGAAGDVFNPGGVSEVPLDGLAEAGLEALLRVPVEVALDLAGVDGVTAVVTGTVLDVLDELGVGLVGGIRDELVEESAERVDDVEVGALVVAADVVGFADAAAFEYGADGAAVVEDEEPVADLLAVAVDGEGLALERVGDHEGDELLGELEGAVVVGAVGDDGGEAVGVDPGADEVIAGGLGGSVGAVGCEGSFFVEGGISGGEGAVDLVGGDVEEAEAVFRCAGEGCVVLARGLEEGERSVDVGAEEGLGAVDGAIDVALCGEVHDSAGLVLCEEARDERGVTDITLNEGVVRVVVNGGEVGWVAGVGELVEIDDGTAAGGEPVQYEV